MDRISANSEQLQLFYYYLLKNYQYLNSITYDSLIKGIIEWDVYRISLDEQLIDLKKDKEIDFLVEFEKKINRNQTINNFYFNILKKIRKFQSLDAYDYYNEKEEKEKNQERLNKKYIWKDESKELDLYIPKKH